MGIETRNFAVKKLRKLKWYVAYEEKVAWNYNLQNMLYQGMFEVQLINFRTALKGLILITQAKKQIIHIIRPIVLDTIKPIR